VLDQDDGRQAYPLTFHVVEDSSIKTSTVSVTVDAIETCVRPYGPPLVNLFWKMVQPSYPILCQQSFMSAYSKSYREIPPSLLGAVYLLSLTWWSYDTALSVRKEPDGSNLRELTHNAIMESYHRPRLSSIQAILLYLQCKPEDPLNPDHTYVWGLVSQALAISESLGLHLDASAWNIPQWERGLRKRLAWAMFLQDKWTSVAYGRPPHIDRSYWTVKDLTLDDFDLLQSEYDDAGAYQLAGTHQFINMVSLTFILCRIQSEFLAPAGAATQNATDLLTKASSILECLNSWQRDSCQTVQVDVRYQRQLNPHGT
jgi:hypothetical protein